MRCGAPGREELKGRVAKLECFVHSLDTKEQEKCGTENNKKNLPDQRGSSSSSSPWTMEWYIVISSCACMNECVCRVNV